MKTIDKDLKETIKEPEYYVAIGASAGGLEALQEFFRHMPVNTGMAFIVIQHLSPDYKSYMNELLARHTKMKIAMAEEGMLVEADTIYLIPPKKNLQIFHGKLYLEDKITKLNLPIDVFFRSIAKDKGKSSIGIILSGTGSDGTLGIKSIKEAGGMIMVQREDTAKFNGMPQSCIATGLVDYIAPPSELPEALLNYIKHPLINRSNIQADSMDNNLDTLTKVILALRDHTGIDFTYYKENTIIRRLERRLSINRFDSLDEYLPYLVESNKEKDILFKELLIGVTRFFRDQEAFDIIKESVIPSLNYNKKNIRMWSAGCSTGEEVYSIAILLMEYMSEKELQCEVKIFATDIDRHSLEIAGKGFYPYSIVADIDPTLLEKYFIKRENGYQISDKIRNMVVFATHNLLKDPPFSKLDLIICRNLFIYLKPDMQQKLLHMFHYSLNHDGFLIMGSSESIGEMHEAYHIIDSKWKIFKYKEGFKNQIIRELPIPIRKSYYETSNFYGKGMEGIRIEKLMEGTIAAFMPPSLIIDENDNIVHIINDINRFFERKPGRFTSKIYDNLQSELALYSTSIIRNLKSERKKLICENITRVKGFDDEIIVIEGRQLNIDKHVFYVLSFTTKASTCTIEKTKAKTDLDEKTENRVKELEKELQVTKENLQATVEELETSNEELQSTNEELIASNEELQSTNEELQSVNEELITVNTEYQIKIDDLIRMNNDLDNLIKNTEVGALYLDRKLCIRKITPVVTKITNILETDIGRPISHISLMSNMNLIDDIYQVVEDLQMIDKEIYDQKGQSWLVRMRPYRTEYNAVEGIMVTFVDISKLKKEEKRYDLVLNKLKSVLELGKMAWWEWDLTSGEIKCDENKAALLGYEIHELPKTIDELYSMLHADDYEKVKKGMNDYVNGKTKAFQMKYRLKGKDGKYYWFLSRGSFDINTSPAKTFIGTIVDIEEAKKLLD